MPVTKAHLFSENHQSLAMVGRALAHPARIRIIELLSIHGFCRNTDLVGELHLSKTSVHNHLRKMEEAGLIDVRYIPNSMNISLNPYTARIVERFLEVHFAH